MDRDKPVFQFRGAWAPAELFLLVTEQKINPTEFLLLLMVESLVRCRGHGCFAGNGWFAQKLDLRPDYVSKLINGLTSRGLLVRYEDKAGQRFLETSWSRAVEGGSEISLGGVVKFHEHISLPTEGKETNTISPPAAGEKEEVGVLDAFQQQAPSRPARATPVTEFDRECVKKLRHIIAPATTAKYSPSAWAKQFALLRQTHSEQEIGSAVEHYEKIFGREYAPEIFCAESFRKKFPKLLASMTREERKNPEFTLDPKLTGVVERLTKMRRWPKGAADKVAATTQASYDNVLAFYKKVNGPPVKDKATARLQKRVAEKYHGEGGPVNLVENWMKSLHERVSNWPDWSGNLVSFAFKEGTKDFNTHGRAIATEWCGKPEVWDRLVEELNDEA